MLPKLIAMGFALLSFAAPGSTAEPDAAQPGATADPLAAPLAAALEAVHENYTRGAKPVPEDVRKALAEEFPDELARGRYVVSQLAIKLLTAVDQFQGTSLRQGMHAVTVDDLIIFSSAPTLSDLWIWAHELHHVRQYQVLGSIDAFARAYLQDCEAIEKAADERANSALGTSIHLRHCL